MRGPTTPPLEAFAARGAVEAQIETQGPLPPAMGDVRARPPRMRVQVAPVAVAAPPVSIIVPTYNEAPSISELFARLRSAAPLCEIIVVDDGSHDGTAYAAEALGARVICRGRKLGLASAVFDGFEIASASVVGVIDADLSHPPEVIPPMIEIAQSGRIAVASRYVTGGSVEAWPLRRRVISITGAKLARMALGVKVRDCMSGFFIAPREAFERTRFRTKGFKLLLNLLVDNPGLDVVEIPYAFTDRVHGVSKLGAREVIHYWQTLRALRA